MIKGLRVKNFKSLKEVDVDLDRLTVLVGENNSGKSAMMESLLYLRDGVGVPRGNDIKNPSYVNYNYDPDTVFYRDGDEEAHFARVAPLLDFSGSNEWDKLKNILGNSQQDVDLTPHLWVGADIKRDSWKPYFRDDGRQSLDLAEFRGHDNRNMKLRLPVEDSETEINDRGILQFGSQRTGRHTQDFLRTISGYARNTLDDMYFITDNRDIEHESDDPQVHEFVGYNGENTVSWLHALRDDEEIFNEIIDAVADISSDIEEIRADMYRANTKTELKDQGTDELFNIVTSGAGLRRLLPIIVQIAAAEDGDVILLEEPEISVYPKTQEKLLEYIENSIERKNIQVIFSTHSHPILTKIYGMLDSDIGHILHFEKSGGQTEVEKVKFDEQEYFSELWGYGEMQN